MYRQDRCAIAIVAAATLTTSASVATAGIIGWVGLVVPHLARSLVGPDFARLLPTAAILGGGYLLVIDTLARTAAEVEIPLGILTAVVGTPFFIWLLASMQRNLVVNIEGRDLTIGYPDRTVGRGLDVALSTGEVLALLGPNGGGKTTLLKTLLGLLKPKAGEVLLGGKPLDNYSIRERARVVAYVPQVHISTFAFTVETGRADGPHRTRQPVQSTERTGPRCGAGRARALRYRDSRQPSLHHDLRRRTATGPAGTRAGTGAAIHRAR